MSMVAVSLLITAVVSFMIVGGICLLMALDVTRSVKPADKTTYVVWWNVEELFRLHKTKLPRSRLRVMAFAFAVVGVGLAVAASFYDGK